MNKLKTFLAMIVALLCSLTASAYDFEKDGIYYTITITSSYSGSVKVTYKGNSAEEYSNEYSGNVIIPSEVTYNNKTYTVNEIGYGAFLDCSGVTSITIPKSVIVIGQYAFSGCTGELVVNCKIPSASMSETYGAFYNSKFTKVTIGADVTSFGTYAFKKCFDLKELIIEDSSNTLSLGPLPANDEGLFYDCPLEYVYLGRNLERRDVALYQPFYQIYDLKEVVIGDNVRWINAYAFYNCRLTSVTIPEGVERIGKYAFYNNCLTSVTIPQSVTSIEDYAFWGCDMSTIKCFCAIPPTISYHTFSTTEGLYVPYSSLSAYKNDPYWNDFHNISRITGILTLVVDGEFYSYETVNYGESLKGLYSSLKEGYTFVPEDNLYETMPANSITISGTFSPKMYKLTYSVDGWIYKIDTVAYESIIVLPDEVLTKEGHTFDGWSDVPKTMPAYNVWVSAIFTKNKYEVTFKIDDKVIDVRSLEYGTKIVVPEAPIKEGYTFNGWGDVADVVPAGDVVYEGSYTINKYRVTFALDGVVNKTELLEYGAAIEVPAFSEREGYTLTGLEYVPSTVPAMDVYYNAVYVANIYQVYYYVGSDLIHVADVAYGENIPEYIYEPKEDGEVFLGWLGDDYETMPAHKVVYTAAITNGIGQLSNNNEKQIIYDLQSRKVTDIENLKEGVYIVNGRKVVLK